MNDRGELKALADEKRLVSLEIEEAERQLDHLAAVLEGLRARRDDLRNRMTARVYDLSISKAAEELHAAGAFDDGSDDGVLDWEVIG